MLAIRKTVEPFVYPDQVSRFCRRLQKRPSKSPVTLSDTSRR